MITDLKTNDLKNPIGIDDKIFFSWRMLSEKRNTMQTAYRIYVSEDSGFKECVWDSGKISSGRSINIGYGGKLKQCTRYYWQVQVKDNHGAFYVSDTAYFETGLMSTEKAAWSGAEWIGSPISEINTDGLDTYAIETEFEAVDTNKVGIVTNARNKDNYILYLINMSDSTLTVLEYCDNAFSTEVPAVKHLGEYEKYNISNLNTRNKIRIEVNNCTLNVDINGEAVISNEENFIPHDIPNQIRKQSLMKFGFKQDSGTVYYNYLILENTSDGALYLDENFEDSNGILSSLGKVKNGQLGVNGFELVNPFPAVNVRRVFSADKKIKNARLYASAMGFYDVYINGSRINSSFYNPGFTDYRKRIQYQTYDITGNINLGKNVIGAVVGKGYYTGFVGYTMKPMVYGRENAFIAKLVIEYTDGSKDTIVTDGSWSYTGKGPIIESDYQQGETCDARLEFDWLDSMDARWTECGIKQWRDNTEPTNGVLENEYFELSAQIGGEAIVERVIKPIKDVIESPKGHFVYDFGQNIVGSIRLQMKGERGKSIKLRYGEMCRRDGMVYIENLRSAANTDVYTFRGDSCGECFEPRFTAHGFRYAEITGNGCDLTMDDIRDMVIKIEGLVITNTPEITGGFECSDSDINQLQSNIQFGQRGNSLLVFTDCPQRNERMGWTGDAQVFAGTAAYNMNIKSFMNKWLLDVRDAQLLYNRSGAVPDTAPLGGDNRPMGGCAGWGDAAVIVPWELYKAYGDENILRVCYGSMKKWVDYQSLEGRQNYGERMVNGSKEDTEHSDLAKEPYIQVQQSRGDHLAYDRTTPFILTATAYAAYVSKLLSKTAKILGKTVDEKKYLKRYIKIKQAFNDAWVCEDGSIAYWGEQSICDFDERGNVINKTYYSHSSGNLPSQTAYAVAIDFELLPEEKSERIRECFKQTIDEHDGRLSVGFLGISHLAPALEKIGLDKYAFSLLEEKRNPSWLYSVINGATTIWERWSSYIAETDTFGDVSMNSFNHYAYGAIGEWMMNYIAGIKPLDPGYKEIAIEPHIGGSLKYAKAWHNTPYGIVKSSWRIEDEDIIYEIEIPPNTRALFSAGDIKTAYGSGIYKIVVKK